MASSDSDSDGAAPGGHWPSSLTLGQTEDLARFCLYVPPAAKLPRPWRISADGFPTQGVPATPAELRAHPGGRYNRKGRRHFWKGKRFDDVIGAFKRRPRAPSPADVVIPPEQAALQQDGNPEDTPGLLAILAQSAEEAAAAAALEAQEEAAQQAAMAAQQAAMAPPEWQQVPPEWQQEWQQAPAAEEEEDSDDVPVDWDDVANRSSSNDDGGNGPAVIDLDSDAE
ncbi:hypothetical protein VPH35_016189 [Triticum aestivum]